LALGLKHVTLLIAVLLVISLAVNYYVNNSKLEPSIELGILGRTGAAENYFPSAPPTIQLNTPLSWTLYLSNTLPTTQIIQIRVKFAGPGDASPTASSAQTEEPVNTTQPVSCPVKSFYNKTISLKENEQRYIPFNFTISGFKVNGDQFTINQLKVNSTRTIIPPLSYSNNTRCHLVFEVWTYDNEHNNYNFTWRENHQTYCVWNELWFLINTSPSISVSSKLEGSSSSNLGSLTFDRVSYNLTDPHARVISKLAGYSYPALYTPLTGYAFDHWETTGNLNASSNTSNPTTVTVLGDGTLRAWFLASKLTVTSPNGGEQWVPGTTHAITWTSNDGPGAKVTIELLKAVNSTIVASIANVGKYNWTIPTTQTLGTDYSIRITNTNNTLTDSSDANFAIVNRTLTVTSPNGGEQWVPGTPHAITWTKAGATGSHVKIELLKTDVVYSTIVTSTANSGSYNWTIPTTQILGTDYSIIITSTNTTVTDSSDANFAIVNRPLTVTSPNGGEQWVPGTPHAITWTPTGIPDEKVKIELLKPGVKNYVILSTTTNEGSYNWTLPSLPPGADYRIRITSTTNTAITDSSDANFAITIIQR